MVEDLGGPATPAVGFAAGIERLTILLEEVKDKLKTYVDICFINADEAGKVKTLQLCQMLRSRGIRAEMDLDNKSFKAQMKRANKLEARYVMILGQSEIDNNVAILKNMETGEQEDILLTQIEQELKDRFPKSVNFKL